MPTQHYFAVCDAGDSIVPLGECEGYDDAFEKSPGNANFVLPADALAKFVATGKKALADAKIRPIQLNTGLYKTVIAVEILSEEPTQDWKLSDIVDQGDTGDVSLRTYLISAEQLSRRAMAAELVAQGSAPEFLLGEHGWCYGLKVDDEVTHSGKTHKIAEMDIQEFESADRDVFVIRNTAGFSFEAFAADLT